jgi:energy-coupling factor transporter transmembrane protein EcfT
MAEVAFHYTEGTTWIHRLDPRAKFLALISLSLLGAGRGWFGMIVLFPVVLISLVITRISLKKLIKDLSGFLIFFTLILVVASFSFVPRAERNELNQWILFQRPGFYHGLLTVTRMIFIILAAAVFTATTTTREMRDAIWWIARPIPFVPAVRLATMFSLVIHFIPLVFEEAVIIRRAQLARGAGGNHKPFRRLRFLGLPLIIRAFRKVDGIVNAMESRCYDENHIAADLKLGPADIIGIFIIAAVFAGTLLLDQRP